MTHPYSVRPRDSAGPVRLVEEDAPELAAAAFLEDWAPDENDPAVVVRELDTGREHCFRIDLATGSSRPCG